MKFTDAAIRALKATGRRYEKWEEKSGDQAGVFGVRVGNDGHKSWLFMYRFDRKLRRMTLGKYTNMTLADAYEALAKARELLRNGEDPGQQHVKRKASDREAFTVKDLVYEFLEKWSKPRKRTWEEDQRCLEKDVIPVIGDMKAKDVRRRDLVLLLDRIMERGKPGMANRTLNVISKMFRFAVSRDIIDASPCTEISRPGGRKPRERVLTEDEIRQLWETEEGISHLNRLALKLMLATAQRRGELLAAEWKEFDFTEKLWTIPGEKTKNGFTHRVPLNDVALGILEEIRQASGCSDYLFDSTRTGAHLNPRATTRALRKAQAQDAECRYRPHDLRRTAASQMASLGVPQFILGKILNHMERTVTGIHYDKYGYDSEKKKAMDTWGRKLEGIVTRQATAAKIVNMDGKRKGQAR